MRSRWKQGEHVSGFGHTGCGKTTLMTHLLPLRGFVVVIGTKPTENPDPVLTRLINVHRYKRCDRLPMIPHGSKSYGVVVWPRYISKADKPRRKLLIAGALEDAFVQRAWTIGVDEVGHVTSPRDGHLGLATPVVDVLTQGRSQGNSFVGFTQRPAKVPLEMYSEATYVYLWRSRNPNDLRRIAELAGGVDIAAIRRELQTLPKHHVMWCHLHTGDIHITLPPATAA